MTRMSKLILIAFLLVLIAAPTAFARLAAVGPLNPGNGFPVYFVDTNGVALELPVKPLGDPITVPPPPNPLSPTMVFDAGDSGECLFPTDRLRLGMFLLGGGCRLDRGSLYRREHPFTGPAWRRPLPPATPRMANRSFFPGSGSGSPVSSPAWTAPIRCAIRMGRKPFP